MSLLASVFNLTHLGKGKFHRRTASIRLVHQHICEVRPCFHISALASFPQGWTVSYKPNTPLLLKLLLVLVFITATENSTQENKTRLVILTLCGNTDWRFLINYKAGYYDGLNQYRFIPLISHSMLYLLNRSDWCCCHCFLPNNGDFSLFINLTKALQFSYVKNKVIRCISVPAGTVLCCHLEYVSQSYYRGY